MIVFLRILLHIWTEEVTVFALLAHFKLLWCCHKTCLDLIPYLQGQAS